MSDMNLPDSTLPAAPPLAAEPTTICLLYTSDAADE